MCFYTRIAIQTKSEQQLEALCEQKKPYYGFLF